MIVITDSQELAAAAKAGGINVPEDINDFDLSEHTHFVVYITVQRGEELPYLHAAVENAKMIAGLSNEEIRTVSIENLIDLGFKFGPPTIALT